MSVMTTSRLRNQPPSPRTIGYTERRIAPAFGPIRRRLRTRCAIQSSEPTISNANPIIVPANPLARAGSVTSGVKSTGWGR